MPSLLLRRIGVYVNRQSGLVLRLSHKEATLEDIQIRLNVRDSCQGHDYSGFKKLDLPLNFRDLTNSEKFGFSRQTTRDISCSCIEAFSLNYGKVEENLNEVDARIGKYDNSGSVDLSSSMQTNVPYPFQSKAKPTHLNMPRGHYRQQAKYIADQLHSFHYANVAILLGAKPNSAMAASNIQPQSSAFQSKRYFSTDSVNPASANEPPQLTKKEKLKAAIKEYGATIFVLHITLSLASLGICYTLVRSGLDLEGIIREWGWTEGATTAGTVGPFVVAYAVHKVLAPARISLSLAVTPFLVQYLRKKGFKLKKK